jgi:hypothetical protein
MPRAGDAGAGSVPEGERQAEACDAREANGIICYSRCLTVTARLEELSMRRLVCRAFGHKRSSLDASFDSEKGWRSFCSRCQAPMIRVSKGDWRLDPERRQYRAGIARGGGKRGQFASALKCFLGSDNSAY